MSTSFKIKEKPEVIKRKSRSSQLSMKFFLLINVKKIIVGILTSINWKNSILGLSEPETDDFLDIFILMSMKQFYNFGPWFTCQYISFLFAY